MLNGLDLFSGIGGLTLALEPWVRPIAYCENDRFAQGVLLSRMADGSLPVAPIWDDVRTLSARQLNLPVDILYGGFPCQDLSRAGLKAGLEGERSGLVSHVFRIARECRPHFLFLENVPDLAFRGLDRLLLDLHALGFDARWTVVSAGEMGAAHLRERIWILAHSHQDRGEEGIGSENLRERRANTQWDYWEPDQSGVGRTVHGLPNRGDRVAALGNAVVPAAAREAFCRLMGI